MTNEARSSQIISEELHLTEFFKNNPHCRLEIKENTLIIGKPWGVDSVELVFDLSSIDLINELNNIALRPQFDAIFHLDTKSIEFVFAFLDPYSDIERDFINRKFQYYFKGIPYKCSFEKPSNRVYMLAQRIRWYSSELFQVPMIQLRPLFDVQRLKELPTRIQAFFRAKEPRSFFLQCDENLLDLDLESLSRHINLATKYYDRNTPRIIIRPKEEKESPAKIERIRYLEGRFPEAMSISQVDDLILQFIEVARESNPRFAFIYYYQVFEYAGFYYIDEEAKIELRRLLKEPSIISCPEERISELFSLISNIAAGSNDDVRIQRIISNYCDPKIIWIEIENDKKFFSSQVKFSGGLILPALISKDTTIAAWSIGWIQNLYNQLTKVRNCIVHARERRLSLSIHPCEENNRIIARYIPIIARMAEQIAFRST
jgi:hypothetical protein